MNVILFGKNATEIKSIVEENGLNIVEKDPEFVINYGGDGTLILSEALYPGIPKVILKNSSVCKLCSEFENEIILKMLAKGEYKIKEIEKLDVMFGQDTISAINDVVIHNKNPRHAIRYKVNVDGVDLPKHEVIGDGLVIATPFGSGGYYRSITDGIFQVGIGVAFNNSTEQSDHMVLKGTSVIKITVTRGPAMVYVDNQEKEVQVNGGEGFLIKRSNNLAKIVSFA